MIMKIYRVIEDIIEDTIRTTLKGLLGNTFEVFLIANPRVSQNR